MDPSPLRLLELLKSAIELMQSENSYLGGLLSNPFLTPQDRIDIGVTRSQLDMDIDSVKHKAAEVRDAYLGGTFPEVKPNVIKDVMDATAALGDKLRNAAQLQAMLAATAGFLGVINALVKP